VFAKRIVIFSAVLLLINSLSPATAGFFKKDKSKKKQAVTQTVQKAQDKKVLLIQIYASWCPGCKNIQPTLDQLTKENNDFELVQLDVSTPSKAKVSAKKADELKIIDFYNANKSKTATVGVFVPTSLEIVSVFQNNSVIEDYIQAINEAKTKEKSLKQSPG
jgi:thiol-disulfide isomerase/thioredoxin